MKTSFRLIVAILTTGVLVSLVLSGCSKPAGKTAADADINYYTCTMHPSVHSKDPGKCPICSMDLVPVMKKVSNETKGKGNPGGMTDNGSSSMGSMTMPSPIQESGKSTEFTVPVERQQQIGVTYAAVIKRPIELSIRSVGTLEPDTSKMFDYVARVDGYVQELKVNSPGQQVSQGQPLITIYSPDLRSTEQELVNLLNDRDRSASRASVDQLIGAAKMRLKLWNVSDQEIAELEKNRRPSDQLVLRSPFDGVVDEVMGRPGMNVKTGDKLVSVLDLSNLWIWAEFYENEVGLLKPGQHIDVNLPAFPSQTFQGQIAVINPMIDVVKRTVRVRIDIPNPKAQLHPGMYANVEVKIDAGEGLTIPVQAALPTGERMLVFLDRGKGKLLPRYVKVGRSFTTFDGEEQENYYQVLNGLQEGDRIVSSANFLIDAESQVQGALKDWAGEEPANTPAMSEKSGTQSPDSDLTAVVKPVLKSYERLHELLAENKFSGVSAEVETLKRTVHQLLDIDPPSKPERYKDLVGNLHGSADQFTSNDIEQSRIEFGQFSAALIAFLKDFMPQLDDPLYTIKCPMWTKSPAMWVQDSTQVKNPFWGSDMPVCGTLEETLQAAR
ncbi:MAG TPA: efflux RND transporter periplasmic adaptor subunit [Chthoniobacterales bacterium]